MIQWFLLKESLEGFIELNHRGSGMNLRFQLIHRVLTREFLSKIKKIRIKPHSIQIKNQSKK